jgi:hypothetical protein
MPAMDSRLSGANDHRGCREELATGERLGKHPLTINFDDAVEKLFSRPVR